MFRDFPEREPDPEAAKDALLFGGAFWGFVIAAYGVYQLALLAVSFVLDQGLAYYLAGALSVAALGLAGYRLYRYRVRVFGLAEILIAMAIGADMFHATFAGTAGISVLAVIGILAQLAGGIFLFVRGCRDLTGT